VKKELINLEKWSSNVHLLNEVCPGSMLRKTDHTLQPTSH